MIALAVLSAAHINPVGAEDGHWRLAKDDIGIQVYHRVSEGLSLREFKSITRVKAPMDRVLELFEDAGRVHEWFSKVKEFKEVGENNSAEGFFYLQHQLPKPVTNRDVLLYRIKKADPDTKEVTYTFTAVSDIYPVEENVVRMALLKSVWRFTPAADGAVDVYYQLYVDPEGKIPKWLVNMAAVRFPFFSLKRFKILAEGGKVNYKG